MNGRQGLFYLIAAANVAAMVSSVMSGDSFWASWAAAAAYLCTVVAINERDQ